MKALEWLYSTQMFGIKMGLENIEKLLTEWSLYPAGKTKVIQVAGTNGKGSTCAMIESVARAHGVRTGFFSSPHLVKFNERIKVYGQDIADADLERLLLEVKELVSEWEHHPTFFELSLTIAMKHFKEKECELIILETGMGGRLDATTAVPADVIALTPIGMDHSQYLGETITEIAGEKAAIIREGKPAFTAPQDAEALRVIEKVASQRRAQLTKIKAPLIGLPMGLTGDHQQWNAALAVEALISTIGELNTDGVMHGLKETHWLGRFQIIEQQHGQIILDCCHNPHSAQVLVKQWQDNFGEEKAHLIFGAAKDKNIPEILAILAPIIGSVEVYEINNPRAESRAELTKMFHQELPSLNVTELLDLQKAQQKKRTLITGSLFLVGEWLELVAAGS